MCVKGLLDTRRKVEKMQRRISLSRRINQEGTRTAVDIGQPPPLFYFAADLLAPKTVAKNTESVIGEDPDSLVNRQGKEVAWRNSTVIIDRIITDELECRLLESVTKTG